MITPLRKHRPDGTLYTRVAKVQTELVHLVSLSSDDLLARCAIRGRRQPGHVSTEAVLYFVRAHRGKGEIGVFERLYKILADRVLGALPRPDHADGETASMSRTLIREETFDRFMNLLIEDRQSYCERLDFFEIRFDGALAKLRLTAQRKVWRVENRSTTLEADEESGEIAAEVEKAAGGYDPFDAAELDNIRYRSRLDEAIDVLPPLQRRIVQMIRHGIPIDSIDDNVVTIRRVLGKAEKTIRNQRDKAYAALRISLTGRGKI